MNPNVQTKDLFFTFFKLGLVAFGGPVAHIGLMEEEIVNRKQWVTREDLLDMLSISHLIPGPNSTELAISIGYRLGKWKGLIATGSAFILPAMVMILFLGSLYRAYGQVPALQSILSVVQPVVLAIILFALFRLFKSTVKSGLSFAVLALLVVWMIFFRVPEILVLATGAVLIFILRRRPGPTRVLLWPVALVAFGPEGEAIARLAPEALLTRFADLPELARDWLG